MYEVGLFVVVELCCVNVDWVVDWVFENVGLYCVGVMCEGLG